MKAKRKGTKRKVRRPPFHKLGPPRWETEGRPPSPAEVTACMTSGISLSRQGADRLGVPWPPPKGWRKRLRQEFEAWQLRMV